MMVAIQLVPDDALYHHGILGQKWGKRNGPPYPLDASDHSTSEKKAGWRKSLDKSDAENQNDKQKRIGLTDNQKKAITIGAAVMATAAVTYGAYRLGKSGVLDKYIESGKNAVDDVLGKKVGSAPLIDSNINKTVVSETINGIKKLSKPESIAETIKAVNPNCGNQEYNNNCTLSAIASMLRQRGLDAIAGSTGGEKQILGGLVEECFYGAKVIDGSAVKFGRSRQDAAEMLVNKFGQNASGVVSVQWKRGGGHAFNWAIKDGVVEFFDGQVNKDDSYVSNVYWKLINPNDSLTLARLDNAEINYDAIKKYFG